MTSKSQVLSAAAKFGFVLDETNSGVDPGGGYTAIFDHPTHSICNDCRSITVTSYPPRAAAWVWQEALDRIKAEGPHLRRCDDPECDYHNEGDE